MTASVSQIPLEIGEQKLVFQLSVLAVARLEDHWKQTKAEIYERLKNLTTGDFLVLLWAGLARFHPEVSLEQVQAWVDDAGLQGLEAMQNAVEAAQPRP